MNPKTEIKKLEKLQIDELKIELQGVNQLIADFFNTPSVVSDSDIAELAERKRTLKFLIDDPIANPFYCFNTL